MDELRWWGVRVYIYGEEKGEPSIYTAVYIRAMIILLVLDSDMMMAIIFKYIAVRLLF